MQCQCALCPLMKSQQYSICTIQGLQENSESGGNAPGKDYVLYSDSEGDMNAWIQVKLSGMA